MRLKEYQVQAIRQAFADHFGAEDHLYLFGSRVYDDQRGGDIDLYIRTKQKLRALPEELDWMLLRKIRNHFLHDYPEEVELNALTLSDAYPQAKGLLFALENLQVFVKEHIK